MDANILNLLILYAGLLVINSALSAWLWATTRDRLYRIVFIVWASTSISFIIQGAITWNSLVLTLGFATAWPVNFGLAQLVALTLGLSLPWRPYVLALASAVATSTVLFLANADFTWVALPVCVAVSLPCLVTVVRVLRERRELSTSMKALLASTVLFSAHNIDFAFLRDIPAMAPLGFTVATLIVFLLSVTVPAVALERVTAERSRMEVEMETTRRIQTRLLAHGQQLRGFDLASYVRPAEQVGGDYFDVYQMPGNTWLLLGDVTGHGIGAGLVMLMAQSTISTLLQSRPDIPPRELNFLANRVLTRNLARLGEERHMTAVAVRADEDGSVYVSGSHDNIYLMRAQTGAVEVVELAHFPLGLGFLELECTDFQEERLLLDPGDLLFIGSDGVTEAARYGDYKQGTFGEPALLELLSRHAQSSPDQMKTQLILALDDYTGGVYHDDVTFLILRNTVNVAEVVHA